MKCYNPDCIDTDQSWDHECLEDIGTPLFCTGFMPERMCGQESAGQSGLPCHLIAAR